MAEVSQTNEGLNVKLAKIRLGGIASLILNYGKAMVGVKSDDGMLNESPGTRPVRQVV